MLYVEVEPGVKVFVNDWGTGTPIVFIHGWPLNHQMFEYQFTQLLKHGYRCIGIDLRGYGKSDKPWGNYNYDVFADDIKKVLETLDLADVTLAGFSMGGAIAIRYMARYAGARVAKLVLFGAAGPCLTKKPDFFQGLDNAPYDNFINACYTDRAQMNADFGNATFYKPISPKLSDWFVSMGMEASPHATAMSVIALRDSDLRPDLETITVPTAIFHGVHDKVAPCSITAEIHHKGIKNSKLILFQNSGHGLFYDEKDKFNEELMRFVG
ncbi:alpha/beta hydrolase [Scytonema sp. NUACC21]